MVKLKIKQNVSDSPAYKEGSEARYKGFKVDECPYMSHYRDKAPKEEGDNRLAWMAGWYNTNMTIKFPKLFNEEHPEYCG